MGRPVMLTKMALRETADQDWRSHFIACAEGTMLRWGCTRGGIVKPYRLPIRIPGPRELDLVGFAEADHKDQETSCYAAHFCLDSGARSHFYAATRSLATPLMIAGGPAGEVTLAAWNYEQPDRPREFKHFGSLDSFETYSRHPDAAGLRVEAISQGKWARGDPISQPGLFGAGILDFAFEATAKEVPPLYESIVRACLNRLERMVRDGKWQRPIRRHENIAALEGEALWAALLVFGACVLRDKGLLSSPRTDAHALLNEAASGKFGCFFRRDRWSHLPPEELDAIAQGLSEYSFRFLSPYGIGLLYERAFVSEKLRDLLAIHYTPVSVANYILGRLRIGKLLPSVKRFAVDLTSGSGTFLHAALREFQTIQARETGNTPSLSSLLPQIWGNDKDPFAAALTSLSLIMRTGVNGWHISSGDMLDQQTLPTDLQPTIVIGNPPFKLDTAFIETCLRLLPPRGLLGTVLPSDFRDQLSGAECRRHLLSSMDILEILELPKGLFAGSNKPTILLIARKRESEGSYNRMVALRSVSKKNDWWAFLADPAVCTERDTDQEGWLQRPHAFMTYQRLPTLWKKLASAPRTLKDSVTGMGNGMQFFGRDADLDGVAESDFTASANSGGWSPYLSRPHGVVEPFALGWEERKEFINYRGYHERFHKACKPSVLSSRKAILPKGTDETTRWRIRACVDDIGLFVTNRLHYILPKAGSSTVEEIVAVLNSPVASAWYADNSVQRDVLCKNLERLPFPVFTPDQRDMLIEIVRSLHALNAYRLARGEELTVRKSGPSGSLFAGQTVEHWMIRELTLAVDAMVFDAYGLTPEERRLVLKQCPLIARPCFPAAVPAAQLTPVTVRRAPPPKTARPCLSTCGRVLAVGQAGDLAIVSVDGLDIGIPVSVKLAHLPVSVRAAGRHFKVKIVENAPDIQGIVLAALHPYPGADQPREQILAHVRDHLEPREEIELGGNGPDRVP